MNNQQVGSAGEALAAEYLTERGYLILDRNWRGATGKRASGERKNQGELDIVALDPTDQAAGRTALVGVEVKTRSTEKYGNPAEAVTPQKVTRLRRLLGQWLAERDRKTHRFTEIRLDAVAVVLNPQRTAETELQTRAPHIEHFRGIS